MSGLRIALDRLESRVRTALRTGDDSGIDVLDYGEISTVIRVHSEGSRFVAKRLPPFPIDAVEPYAAAFAAYIDEIGRRGIAVVPSELHTVIGDDGVPTLYCVQPLVDELLVDRLRASTPDAARRLADEVVTRVAAAIGPDVGLDAQVANWALDADENLVYLDVTTPMMRDGSGTEILDLDLFLASLPWAMRGGVRRFLLDEILGHYYDPRAALVDLAGNLHKERLTHLTTAFVAASNEVVAPAIGRSEVDRYYRLDALMWEALQRLRRADRWWQRSVRRRPYPFLLPGRVER